MNPSDTTKQQPCSSSASDPLALVEEWRERSRRLQRENHLLRKQVLKMQEERRLLRGQLSPQPAPTLTSSGSTATPTPADRAACFSGGSSDVSPSREDADALRLRVGMLERQAERDKAKRAAAEKELRREIEELRSALRKTKTPAALTLPATIATSASPCGSPTFQDNGAQSHSIMTSTILERHKQSKTTFAIAHPLPEEIDAVAVESPLGHKKDIFLLDDDDDADCPIVTVIAPSACSSVTDIPTLASRQAAPPLQTAGIQNSGPLGTGSALNSPEIAPLMLTGETPDDAGGMLRRTASRRELRRMRIDKAGGSCTGRVSALDEAGHSVSSMTGAIPRRWRQDNNNNNNASSPNVHTDEGDDRSVPFNPNQLGDEIKPTERNRSWYVQQALSAALHHCVLPCRKEGGRTNNNNNNPSSPLAGSGGVEAWMESVVASNSSDDDDDPLKDTRRDRDAPKSRQLSRVGSFVYPETTAAASPRAAPAPLLYKDVNVVALQRAIEEVIPLHFHAMQNTVVLTPGTRVAKNVTLEAFAEDNTDPNLLKAFSPPHMTVESMEMMREQTATQSRRGSTAAAAVPKESYSGNSAAFRDDEVCVSVHAPVIFNQIRTFLNVDSDDLRAAAKKTTWRQSVSPGKSGTTLYYFGDYVMKSVHESEFTFFSQRFLPAYVRYCERNPHTLLPRFYMLLSIKWLKLGTTTRLLLMQNVFSTRYYINRIYDVKGSTVGRSALQPGKAPPRSAFGAVLLKDNDLPAQLIICGQWQRATLLAQFRSDVGFLHGLNIVDYSCMIGVRSRVFSREEGPSKTIVVRRRGTHHHHHHGPNYKDSAMNVAELETIGIGKADNTQAELDVCIHGCDGGLLSVPIYTPGDDTTAREDVYYLGIIDVLQEYNSAKRFENFAKGFVNDRTQISVVPPKDYAERLYGVLERISI